MNEARFPPAQLPLALRIAPAATFDTYVVDPRNAAACAHVRSLTAGERRDAIWLAGETAAGKSHLLQAACVAADAAGTRVIYLPLGRHAELMPGVLANLDGLGLVALDDVDEVAGNGPWERALFDVLNAATQAGAAVLLAARRMPASAGIALPDLASRAAGAVVYRLATLTDEGQITALMKHAASRGLSLDRPAARFLARRVRRDMGTLCRWLDELNALALAARRQVTIPMIRTALAAGTVREAAR